MSLPLPHQLPRADDVGDSFALFAFTDRRFVVLPDELPILLFSHFYHLTFFQLQLMQLTQGIVLFHCLDFEFSLEAF